LITQKTFDTIYDKLLSIKTKDKSETIVLRIAIISFLIHLGLIYLAHLQLIFKNTESELLRNPIAAIYTPFSFILIYEVYLLVYYLPKSITTYIGKQYEIITLIIIRRIFKDLSNLELSSDWFKIKNDLQFTYDIIASILLFYLLYLYYANCQKSLTEYKPDAVFEKNITQFIKLKKVIAVCLVPILLILATYTLASWTIGTMDAANQFAVSFKNVNNVFFDQFFTLLIVVDVILLLLSFFHTDKFYKVIRNSGFIISTILIRLSFSVTGLTNTVLIISAVIFGLLILLIHNKYEQHPTLNKD
jgi:hypothetical protein